MINNIQLQNIIQYIVHVLFLEDDLGHFSADIFIYHIHIDIGFFCFVFFKQKMDLNSIFKLFLQMMSTVYIFFCSIELILAKEIFRHVY
jgi:hypothetical protein